MPPFILPPKQRCFPNSIEQQTLHTFPFFRRPPPTRFSAFRPSCFPSEYSHLQSGVFFLFFLSYMRKVALAAPLEKRPMANADAQSSPIASSFLSARKEIEIYKVYFADRKILHSFYLFFFFSHIPFSRKCRKDESDRIKERRMPTKLNKRSTSCQRQKALFFLLQQYLLLLSFSSCSNDLIKALFTLFSLFLFSFFALY